jgi:hypothetical protein
MVNTFYSNKKGKKGYYLQKWNKDPRLSLVIPAIESNSLEPRCVVSHAYPPLTIDY